ncbi:ABC transporter ATP-binding protein [Caldalkalibacillus salinus]|uniref:ABC transporter ATP-binding protein n=1 Tax=Caldalkalibacillus salinus TaxID=2803787 RepID=UPI001921E96B|nr:dipeptide/oligopeptide/nickel ABC transporter ATP-binding protein [Caldalkalibacillus salinus]
MSQLVVDGLTKIYSKSVQALDDVTFRVNKGESVGIIGESGSGKSTLAKVLLGLETYATGRVIFQRITIPPKKRDLMRQYRQNMQLIVQDSHTALNPKLPIWKSLLEPLDNFKALTPSFIPAEGLSRQAMAEALLERVGLDKRMARRYPSELSGGQKQRVSIARAVSIEPTMLICDEPTASLDMTVQVDILNLLKEIQNQTHMTVLFISHDIRSVTYLCDRVMVLKEGRIVDQFAIEALYDRERHAYTQALIRAVTVS